MKVLLKLLLNYNDCTVQLMDLLHIKGPFLAVAFCSFIEGSCFPAIFVPKKPLSLSVAFYDSTPLRMGIVH